ncbi:hypothetical protein STRIP9103_07194, partial [Streptomyces ipomoeae 91-03]
PRVALCLPAHSHGEVCEREGWRGHHESGTNDRVAPIGNRWAQDPDSRRGEPHVRTTPQEARCHRT